MSIKVCLLFGYLFWGGISLAAEGDTVLNMVISKPYFYNVVQNDKGDIYAGTAKGSYAIHGEKIDFSNAKSGYLKLGKNGAPEIDSTGISNHESTRYLYLLPYPSEKRQEYHTGNGQYFYIVSGGRLFIFDIVPYSITYRNQSIRSISKNLVGGYSGVYRNGKKLDFPTHTDGFIREFGDTAFICYGGLFMISPGKTENFLKEVPYGAFLDSVEVGYMEDVYHDALHSTFFFSTKNGVYEVGEDLKSPKKICAVKPGEPIVLIGSKESFMFTVANKMAVYSFNDGSISYEDSTTENIISGYKLNNRKIYTLSNHALYENTTSAYFSKVEDFNDVHTLLPLNEKELIIAGNQGLYLFNLETHITSAIIQGVEFNRKALYQENNKLYAGSINGLYTIDVGQIQQLISRNQAAPNDTDSFLNYLYWGSAIVMLSAIFLFIISRLKRQLRDAQKSIIDAQSEMDIVKEKKPDKEMVEDFIRKNLATASIKSINEHFHSNTNQIYALLEPDKPGTIIQEMRLKLVMEMKKSGSDLQTIADSSGLSKSYIKKIKADH